MWTPELTDSFLEAVLPCKDKSEFERRCAQFYVEHLGSTRQRGIVEGEQYLRRKANGRNPYLGPVADLSRTCRTDLPWTWVEEQVLWWAFVRSYADVDMTDRLTNNDIAVLLQRTEQEIINHRNQDRGIQGFDL